MSNEALSPAEQAEAQLQQELREMFAVDTQTYLQRYSQLAQNLQAASWTADIQEMYRCIHTIKGGAVTVSADAILHVSKALEDVLSDLRYLNSAPPLANGELSQALLEAGELLTGTLSVKGSEAEVSDRVAPTLARISQIHEQLRERFLAEWDENAQLRRDFVEQGFDLVVLPVEMGVEQLNTEQNHVDADLLAAAAETLKELETVGQDLTMGEEWGQLLDRCHDLLQAPEASTWKQLWPEYLLDLKRCAYGGELPQTADSTAASPLTAPVANDALTPPLVDLSSALDDLAALGTAPLPELDLPEVPIPTLETPALEAPVTATSDIDMAAIATPTEDLPATQVPDLDLATLETLELATPLAPITEISELAALVDPDAFTTAASQTLAALGQAVTLEGTPNAKRQLDAAEASVQIPVPLGRLDRSAREVVDTLLQARAAQGLYRSLQSQLVPLLDLAKESAQYIASLRQLQDDYALLNTSQSQSVNPSSDGPTPERYRQGYVTINRLLETSLRLTELGSEAEKIALQTSDSFQSLDRTIRRLQTTVEESRLVPFRTLSFRARAIVRDLSNRYQKPVQLHVAGEQLELDAGTTRQLEPALLHLLRNAFDHGLESETERLAADKSATGNIWLTLQRRGNRFLLAVRDDGRGINPEAIAHAARTKNLPLQDTGTTETLLAVLTQPGFSSRTEVSDVSGRGVGMDVVSEAIATIDGRLSLESEFGRGTTFRMDVPVPHLLVRCILLEAEGQVFAVPADEVSTTALLEQLFTKPAAADSPYQLLVQDLAGDMPAIDLRDYWHHQVERSHPPTSVCLRVDRPELDVSADAAPGIWLLAEELVGQEDLPIELLPDPLKAPAGLLGMSLQTDGSLIPVLDPIGLQEALQRSSQSGVSLQTAVSPVAPLSVSPTARSSDVQQILVVDDAALMRRRIEATLTASGYSATPLSDGLEAWNWLQENPEPALVITDIEMPNMDGFTLIERCRQAGISCPMLVVSSRLLEEWGREASRVGASGYLTKGFSSAELVQTVSNLIA
ncbi:MAG: response regulator [Cyanobacteria bacterium P01_D01_bin.123]